MGTGTIFNSKLIFFTDLQAKQSFSVIVAFCKTTSDPSWIKNSDHHFSLIHRHRKQRERIYLIDLWVSTVITDLDRSNSLRLSELYDRFVQRFSEFAHLSRLFLHCDRLHARLQSGASREAFTRGAHLMEFAALSRVFRAQPDIPELTCDGVMKSSRSVSFRAPLKPAIPWKTRKK